MAVPKKRTSISKKRIRKIDPIIQTICDAAIIPPMEKTTRKKSIGINKKVPPSSLIYLHRSE